MTDAGPIRRRRPLAVRLLGSVLAIVAVAILGALLAEALFDAKALLVIRPVEAALTAYALFVCVLLQWPGSERVGELGFVYLSIALAYTLAPAVKMLSIGLDIPSTFDSLNFGVLAPTPEQLGQHFWRHALFIAAAAAGFLAVRLQPLRLAEGPRPRPRNPWSAARLVLVVVLGAAALELLLSGPVETYLDHYTRFAHLPWALRQIVTVGSIVKAGGYFVLLTLLFARYREHRPLILLLVPALTAYEVWYSFGSRIIGAEILLAVFGLYHLCVRRISLAAAATAMLLLVTLFSVVGILRQPRADLRMVWGALQQERTVRADELDAVYCTGFTVYAEREQGTLPPRNWRMFVYELFAVIPFTDRTAHHPQFWYARHYFPHAVVPPQTMGVIADSGLWFGEIDLLLRSLLNGALFAGITRWFLRRRSAWWALTLYIYCYATCVMTWKYSVFYQLIPLVNVVLPSMAVVAMMLWLLRKGRMIVTRSANGGALAGEVGRA